MTEFTVERIGLLMEPLPGKADEVEGVLNPAVARGSDGQLYLFPRIVAKGNYSRIGVARVQFTPEGEPCGVERLGIALEPEAEYERLSSGGGGCEDPRVSYVDPLGHYVMSYSALGDKGPRIAIARSGDLITWERVGLARFDAYKGITLGSINNKDGGVFPTLVPDPQGRPSIALVHRPMFAESAILPGEDAALKANAEDFGSESIWISYWPMTPGCMKRGDKHFESHSRVASPTDTWDNLKLGLGAPPVRCRHGWLVVYHGVHSDGGRNGPPKDISYQAGIMILAEEAPHHVIYRSTEPVLSPQHPTELKGVVDRVVFPSGIDRRDDIGQPDRYDIYYGMADNRIGVAKLIVPETLPEA